MLPYTLIAFGVALIIGGASLLYSRYEVGSRVETQFSRSQKMDTQTVSLIELCKASDPEHMKLSRRPEVFMPFWLDTIERMRRERNTYDLLNLYQTEDRAVAGLTQDNFIAESMFTLQCLQRNGYLAMIPNGKRTGWWGVQFDNFNLKFSDKWLELFGR